MHTFFLFATCLSAALAIPVAQLLDQFDDDQAITNDQGTKSIPQIFSTDELEHVSAGQEGGNLFLTGATNYLQAQVPSQDAFGNFGGGCPSDKLYCCQGGSGSPGTLISDAAFNYKCIPYNDKNALNDKCQQESNGSCCQSSVAPGGTTVWQCVSAPIKVVPREQDPDQKPGENSFNPPAGANLRSSPSLYDGKGNWGQP